MEFAASDYEPTAQEVMEFVELWASLKPGHGSGQVVPTLWPHLLTIPRLYISNRRENEDGSVVFDWFVPELPCH